MQRSLHGARLDGRASFGGADRIEVFGDDLFRLDVGSASRIKQPSKGDHQERFLPVVCSSSEDTRGVILSSCFSEPVWSRNVRKVAMMNPAVYSSTGALRIHSCA